MRLLEEVMKHTLIKREEIYCGKIVRLEKDELQDERGNRFVREIVHHPGAVAIVPFVSDDEIFLIRQYRYAHDEIIYEIPAGTLEKGEDYKTCAHREVEEELGYKAGNIEKLFLIYPSPGVMTEKIAIFKASDLKKTRQNLESDEVLTIERMKFNHALALIKEGKIKDAKTICALLYLKEFGA